MYIDKQNVNNANFHLYRIHATYIVWPILFDLL